MTFYSPEKTLTFRRIIFRVFPSPWIAPFPQYMLPQSRSKENLPKRIFRDCFGRLHLPSRLRIFLPFARRTSCGQLHAHTNRLIGEKRTSNDGDPVRLHARLVQVDADPSHPFAGELLPSSEPEANVEEEARRGCSGRRGISQVPGPGGRRRHGVLEPLRGHL